MEVMGQSSHEGQLDLLLHELKPAVDNSCRESHGNKAGNAIQESLIILRIKIGVRAFAQV